LEHLKALEAEVAQLKQTKLEEKSSLEALREELQVGKTKSVSRRWLVETFTEGNEISASRRSSISEVTPVSPRSSLRAQPNEEDMAAVSDVILSTIVDEEAADLLQRVGKLDFDVIDCAALPAMKGHLLQALFKKAVSNEDLLGKLEDQGNLCEAEGFEKTLYSFLGRIEEMYRADVPYHTAVHAADMMTTMEWFLRSPSFASQVTELDHVMALISCAIHDVGHPGRNNLFQAKTMSSTAVIYNDKSILENMHVSSAFQVMQQDGKHNWFGLLKPDFVPAGSSKTVNLQQYVRRGMIEIVLGTDMTKHNQHQKSLTSRLAARDNQEASLGDKLEFIEAVAHAADISNPCKPRKMMLHWTQRVVEEFWAQGDEEKLLNVEVSPMCDRTVGEDSIPKQQIGFIDFVIAPFYKPLAELLPEVQEATDNMTQNRAFWSQKEAEEATFADLFES